ncbi:hypothetical protein INT44_000984 [Umbelopsis vinacea]|uniref:Transcription factor IIIC 90kDa subunit N-terminal domain-containing protein n=1 Tax=Umbelopsis vinacea TaxID=44442 RepID=A0A8H7Q922_9FUNG|nr:hypothetical protein INT44_000984 [Umbelopsis vinacea]
MDQLPSAPIVSQPFKPDSITWSDDNKIAITTANAVQIYTPAVRTKDDKTVIQYRSATIRCEDQDESARFDTTAWAPAKCWNPPRCTIAIVTISHKVLLFQESPAADNADWNQVEDITPHLGTRENIMTHILSAAWSKAVVRQDGHFGALALGSKSGHITLWSPQLKSEIVFRHPIFDGPNGWITLLEWSDWRRDGAGHSAFLFAGASNGKVASVKVDLVERKLHMTTLDTFFLEDSRMPTLIKITGSSEPGSQLKVAVTKSTSVSVGLFACKKDGSLVLNHGKWIQQDMRIPAYFSGAIWSKDGNYLHLFSSQYTNYSFIIDGLELKVDEVITEEIRNRTNKALRTQAYEMAKKVKIESQSNESYRAEIWGLAPSPNGIYFALCYTLSPTIDRDMRESGLDSWCACVLSIEDSATARPMVSQLIHDNLMQRTKVEDLLDLVDYLAVYDAEVGLDKLLSDVKSTLDAQMTEQYDSTSTVDLQSWVNKNPAIYLSKALVYISEQMKAYTLPALVSEKAKAQAAEAKNIISGFYLQYILQLLLKCPESQWLAMSQQERCNELLLADSVLLWHPRNTELLNSALRVYQRLSKHKIMVDSTELEMTSSLLNKKRVSIDANDCRRVSKWSYVGYRDASSQKQSWIHLMSDPAPPAAARLNPPLQPQGYSTTS